MIECLCQNCGRLLLVPFYRYESGEIHCNCGGDVCGCDACHWTIAALRSGVRNAKALHLIGADLDTWTPENGWTSADVRSVDASYP